MEQPISTKENNSNFNFNINKSKEEKVFICYNCNSVGHRSNKCPFPKSVTQPFSKILYLNDYIAKLIIPCYINGISIVGLVDSGVTHFILSLTWAQQNNLIITPISGLLYQVMKGSQVFKIGQIKVLLENGNISLKVADL